MRYQRSLEIETRLAAVLRLIRAGKYSTPAIAERVGVSIPTVSRYVQALRDRGHDIKAEWHQGGWRYVLVPRARASSPALPSNPCIPSLDADRRHA